MDNICVGVSFICGLLLAQIPDLPYSDITAMALVGLTIYYFLHKFDGKMQEISEQNKLIQQRQELDSNTHNKALEQLSTVIKDLSALVNVVVEEHNEKKHNE